MTEKFICFPFFNVRITVSHCVYDFHSWESGSNNAVKHMLAKWTEGKSLSHTLLTGVSCSGIVKRPSRSSKSRIGKAKVRSGNAPVLSPCIKKFS